MGPLATPHRSSNRSLCGSADHPPVRPWLGRPLSRETAARIGGGGGTSVMSLLRPLYSTRRRPSYHPMRQMKPHRTPPLQRSTQPARALYRRKSIRQYANLFTAILNLQSSISPSPHLPISPSPHLLHCSLRIHSLCPSPYSLRVVISFSSFPLSFLFVFVRSGTYGRPSGS